MPSSLAASKNMESVNVIVKHTFIEVQGVEENASQRRKSDLCPIRASRADDFKEGILTPSTCSSDNEDADEDSTCPIVTNASCVGLVDPDEIIGAENSTISTRRLSMCSMSTASFAGSIDDDDILGVSSCGTASWQSAYFFEPCLMHYCADENDLLTCRAPLLSFDNSDSYDTSFAHDFSNWQPACQDGEACMEALAFANYSSTNCPEDVEAWRMSALSFDSSSIHDISWQPAFQVLSTPSPLQISGSNQDLSVMPPGTLEDEDRTSVMLRNVPNTMTQTEFVEELIARGYRGLFDFVYMPMNLRSDGTNFRYAFVNFTSATVAVQLMKHLKSLEHDEREWQSVWSACQGLDANIERYRNSPLMHELVPSDCKPALYDTQGLRVQFPAPTKNIPKPRIHSRSKACEKGKESQDIASKSQCLPGRSKKNAARASGNTMGCQTQGAPTPR